jgi:hypothetical protein
MQRISEYERNAAECRQMARRTQNQNQKRQLEDIANTWDELARERHHHVLKPTDSDPDK